jgi:hypothetical protein
MKMKIGRKVYDTAKAEEVGKQVVSYYGDSYGFEEIMFRKSPLEFFLFARGGQDSQYREEQIVPLSLKDARDWLERITGYNYAHSLIPDVDPSVPVKAKSPASKAKKETAAKTTLQ